MDNYFPFLIDTLPPPTKYPYPIKKVPVNAIIFYMKVREHPEVKGLLFEEKKNRLPHKRLKLSNYKIVDTYIKNNFHITNTCKKLKISASTWYEWQETYPELKKMLDIAKESIKDDIEKTLITKAKEGDTQLLLYLAKTLLRDRGYGQDTQTSNQNTQVNIVLPEDTSKKYEWWGSSNKPDEQN
jgi:hypothetical protein